MGTPLLPAAVAVWLGAAAVVLGAGVTDPVPRLAIAAALVLAAVAGRRMAWQLAPVGLAVGVASAALHVMPLALGPVGDAAAQRAVVTATARVASDPVAVRTRDALDWSARDVRVVRLDLVEVTARGHHVHVHVPVTAFVTGAAPVMGQVVRVTGRLAPPPPGRAVAATLTVTTVTVVRPPPRFHAWALRLRAALHDALRASPDAARQLVPGLALGDTRALGEALGSDMRAAGLSHLTAVSGANVALVVAGALIVTRGRRRSTRVVVALGAIAAFTVLVRPQPSVVRAAAMGAVAAVAILLRRRTQAVVSLCAAVCALVVWDPWLAVSYGFALSVLATGGLILSPARPVRWWTRLLAATLAAQLAVLPVAVALGSPVTLASIPANLVAVPLAAPAMVLGLATCAVAAVWPAGGAAMAWLPSLPATAIAWVAHAAARWDAAVLPWPSGPMGVGAASMFTLWCATLAARWHDLDLQQRASAGVAGAVLAAACLSPPDPVAPVWPPRGWVMVQCDVGQGDATVLRVAAHQAVVVDVGGDDALIDRCLRQLRITHVPLLVLTHFHADHVGGLAGALRRRRVGEVAVTALDEPLAMRHYVDGVLAREGVGAQRLTYPAVLRVRGLTLHCVWPARLITGQSSDANNASVVLRFDIEGARFLLPGDIEPPAQDALASMLSEVDVVKIPHHGSAHQSPRLAARLAPRIVTVSVGADNDYGHPAASALALYRALGARIVRTDLSGDIAIVLRDGAPLAVTRSRHT